MAFKLDGRYPTIASPWGDYAVYSFPDASKIGCSDRQPIMDAMNSIIAINWKAIEPHWTASSSPFDSKYSLILVYDRVELIAFSVYRVMPADSDRCRPGFRDDLAHHSDLKSPTRSEMMSPTIPG